MKTTITKGTKVKFLNDKNLSPMIVKESKSGKFRLPTVGEIYTVRGFGFKGEILLEEVRNPLYEVSDFDGKFSPMKYYGNLKSVEFGFSQDRFVTLDEISENSDKTLDEVLDKISKSGMSSLTMGEKKVLENFKK